MKLKQVFVVLFLVAAFAVAVNAQRYGSSTCGLIPGPCMERVARQAYAPVDYMLNNYGYGYGGYGYYGNGRIGTSAIVGAASGAIAGGLVAAAVSHRSDNRAAYAVASNGGQYYTQPVQVQARFRESKPLDCRKKQNKATCEALAREQEATARQESERQALSASPWRLYNRSGFTIQVFDGDWPLGRMRVNQSWRVLEPTSGFRAVILAPDFSGAITEHDARIRPANDFQGWVITAPKVEE